MPTHTIRQGQSIHTLAREHGVGADTIWQHPSNESLRELRKKPSVLHPGDEVFVPERTERWAQAPTGRLTRFELKRRPLPWSVRFLDRGEPRGAWTFRATVEGATHEGTLDDGWIRLRVPANARSVEVELTPPESDEDDAADTHELFTEHYRFALHHLDPADTPSGARQRLRALGTTLGPAPAATPGATAPEWDPPLRAAIRHLQKRYGLSVSGEVDAATRAKLEELAGA